jgi:B12-binding domain/radical SAM domain protein
MKIAVISPQIYTYGAMVIGGILREKGYQVRISHDLIALPDETVFLSLYSTMHLIDERVRSFTAERSASGDFTCVGGPVSSTPEMVLGELGVDAVILGEGEETVLRILEEEEWSNLPGIAYEENGVLRIQPPDHRPSVEHPLPLIPDDIGEQSIRGANVYVETHRGCIGGCTFCQVPRFFGREIRSRSITNIIEEVKAFRQKGVTRLSISGGTGSLYNYQDGTLDPGSFIELLEALASVMGPRNVSSPDIRVDCISDEILEAIRKYTIGWLFFGFESGSNRILHQMGKGVTVHQNERAVEQCRQHGLKTAGSFIVGYPTERDEDFQATKDFIATQGLDDVFISIAEPIPGTPLADLALKVSQEENPTFTPHTGEFGALNLTESEARCFELMMHADMYKPILHVVTDEIFNLYLSEARKQGKEIRAVTELLRRYSPPPKPT